MLRVLHRLDAGDTAAYQVSARAREGFEVFEGQVLNHGAQVQVTVWDRESGAPPASYLDGAEVERLRRLLALAASESRLGAR